MQRQRPWGFTLIELLIVVAIISVLAAIAVPNFLEAQTRSKVARVKADQRTLATALETYMIDNSNKYPIRRDLWDGDVDDMQPIPPFTTKVYDPAKPNAAVGMHVLTTPILYLSTLPSDIFNRPALAMAAPGNPYSDAIDYWDPLQTDKLVASTKTMVQRPGDKFPEGIGRGWVLISVGPDQFLGYFTKYDYPPESALTKMNSIRHFYDPTNGTISAGNVYRFSGNLSQAYFITK